MDVCGDTASLLPVPQEAAAGLKQHHMASSVLDVPIAAGSTAALGLTLNSSTAVASGGVPQPCLNAAAAATAGALIESRAEVAAGAAEVSEAVVAAAGRQGSVTDSQVDQDALLPAADTPLAAPAAAGVAAAGGCNTAAGQGTDAAAAAAAAAADAATGGQGDEGDAAAVVGPPGDSLPAASFTAENAVAVAAAAAAPRAPTAAAAEAQGAVQATQQYGAATASLTDPACTPGTEAFAAAKAENERLLKQYTTLDRQLYAKNVAKPDMQAFKQLRIKHKDKLRAGDYGHVPGVAVGDRFVGKGALAMLGLHRQIVKGIDYSRSYGDAAVAIVVSGGYKDDEDEGRTFTYTGTGGQEAKRQVEDQSYSHHENAALVNNFETGTPLRVFRKIDQAKGYPVYVYEGLYTITGHRLEPSADGPLVIKFTLQGVPGHSAVSAKVEYKSVRARALRKVQLAGADSQERAAKRRRLNKSYRWDFTTPGPEKTAAQVQQRQKSGGFGRLVTPDISGGLERVPIPVWNDVDDDDVFHVHNGLQELEQQQQQQQGDAGGSSYLKGFEYITDYRFSADGAEETAVLAGQKFAEACPVTCGIQYHGGQCPYNDDGCLWSTHPCGVMECDAKCRGAKGSSKTKRALCKRNGVVSEGIKYPLEVFKTQDRGWAVRCCVDVPVGAVLCAYLGRVVIERTADQLRGADGYLYDLSHFQLLEDAATQQQQQQGQEQEQEEDSGELEVNPHYPFMPPELRDQGLVVDGGREGNVARFINHSCDPNCMTTVVFAKGARSQLLHYTVIVAAKDIPKLTELTYHYGDLYIEADDAAPMAEAAADAGADAASETDAQAAAGAAGEAGDAAKQRTRCRCGAACCKGWLKR